MVSEEDQAARDAALKAEARQLLAGSGRRPCLCNMSWCTQCGLVPTVAAALRSRDDLLKERLAERDLWIAHKIERIAALEAEILSWRDLVISAVYQWAGYDTVEGRRYGTMGLSTLEEMFEALGLKDCTYADDQLRAALAEVKR